MIPAIGILASYGILRTGSALIKSGMRSWAGNISGIAQGALSAAFKSQGWKGHLIPFFGPAKAAFYSIPKMITEQMSLRKGYATALKAFRPAVKGQAYWRTEVTQGVATPIYRMLKENVGWGTSMTARGQGVRRKLGKIVREVGSEYGEMLSGISKLPEDPVTNLLRAAVDKAGLTFKGSVTLESATSAAIKGSQKALNQGFAARSLIGPHLAANMAVVGIPTLVSGVGTAAVIGAIRRKGRNRLRGYE